MKSAPARGLLLVVSLANQLVVLGGRLVVVCKPFIVPAKSEKP